MEYRRCKIKNIAIMQKDEKGRLTHADNLLNPHLEHTIHLPDDCIRLSWIAKDWCDDYCRECYG